MNFQHTPVEKIFIIKYNTNIGGCGYGERIESIINPKDDVKPCV
jgi:hypothetical protein